MPTPPTPEVTIDASVAAPVWRIIGARDGPSSVPGTWLPTSSDREALEPGDIAKIPFEIRDEHAGYHREFMWVEIAKAGGGSYEGRLLSESRRSGALSVGTVVNFTAQHIMDFRKVDEVVTASQRSVSRGKKPSVFALPPDPRRTILVLALVAVAALGAYPPWNYTFHSPSAGQVVKPAPRALLLSPPPPESRFGGVVLDLTRLSTEWLVVAAGAAALALVFSSRKRG